MHRNYVVLSEIRRNKVYLVQYQNGSKCYIKKYLAQQYQNIYDVLNTLKGQTFRNIVKIYDVSIENNELICVVEEACKWNLREIMKNKWINFETTSEILKCLLDIIGGLLELKKLNIFHRDIKPDNIVYDGKDFKIIDFETAKKFQDDRIKVQSLDIGTQGYRAPEIIKDRPYSSLCDVWSLGCLFYYILFKQDRNDMDQLIIPKQHNYEDKIIKILKKMLEEDETKRIKLNILQDEVQKLYYQYNNSNSSTRLEQNTTNLFFDQNNEINVRLNDIKIFNEIMIKFILKEQNKQKTIYLYQFWAKRLEKRFPSEQNQRLQIENLLLVKIKEFKESNIKINLFASIDEIKNQLKCMQELNEFYDF